MAFDVVTLIVMRRKATFSGRTVLFSKRVVPSFLFGDKELGSVKQNL